MDNNLLKYLAFVKAVEKGSFTKAAGHFFRISKRFSGN